MGAGAATLAKGKDIASLSIRYDARMGIGWKSHALKNTVIKIKEDIVIWKIWLITTLLSYIIYTRRIYAPKSIWEKLFLWVLCINPIMFFIAVFLKGVGDDS
jgi:hypothetical protein